MPHNNNKCVQGKAGNEMLLFKFLYHLTERRLVVVLRVIFQRQCVRHVYLLQVVRVSR